MDYQHLDWLVKYLYFHHYVCIIHTMNSSELIKKLEADGWELRSIKGSHHICINSVTGAHISIPHPRKDLGVGLVHKILKQAGLK